MATNYYVSKTGTNTSPYNSWATAANAIGTALGLATSGDTVWVRGTPSTYTENITIGSGVIVRSETGLPADVTIDGGATGTTVTMTDSTSWLIGVTVTNGLGSFGGGIVGGTIFNCIVTGNHASQGAGMYSCILYNCLIIKNTTSSGAGGGVKSCQVYNSTISDNSAANGYGGGASQSTLYNSISWGNNAADFECSYSYCYTSNPFFINSSGGNYRLSNSSSCIDAGLNYSWMRDPGDARSKDLDGNPRIWNSIVDIGAYESEFWESSSQSSLSSSSLSSISSLSSLSSQSSSSSSSSISSLSSLSSISSLSSLSSSSLSSSSLSSISSSSVSSESSLSSRSPSSQSSESSLSSLSSSSLSSLSSSSSTLSSVSETPDPTIYIYKDWLVSQSDHLSAGVQYQVYLYDNIELKYPLMANNSLDQNYCFQYDASGSGKHFIPFPSGGLNHPPQNAIVRYQINKNRLKRFFISKSNNLYQMSFDSKSTAKTYNFNSLNIRNISLNDVNGDIWAFCDNNFVYCISNADFQSKTRSLFLSEGTIFVKIDGIRNSIWQIENSKIVLKDYYGTELFNEVLPLEINEVVDCLIIPNTGEIFILAESGLSTSGTILISYLRNRGGVYCSSSLSSSSSGDLLYIDSYIESISDWGIHDVLVVSGDGWIKKYFNGVLTDWFDLSSYGINANYISSMAGKNIYILDRNTSMLNKINDSGELVWNISLPVVSRPETMKIVANFDGQCIWVASYDSCSVILDNDYYANIENNLFIGGIGNMWSCLEKQLVLPHIWMKNERL